MNLLHLKKKVIKSNNFVKANAKSCVMQPSQINRDSVVQTKIDSRVYLPNKFAQKPKIRRARTNQTKEPNSLEEILIPDRLLNLEGEFICIMRR